MDIDTRVFLKRVEIPYIGVSHVQLSCIFESKNSSER